MTSSPVSGSHSVGARSAERRGPSPRLSVSSKTANKTANKIDKELYRALLVPIDLSPLSDRVVGRAASLPVAPGGTVTLLHCIPTSLPIRASREAARDAQKALAGHALQVSKGLRPDVSVKCIVTVGAPAAEISESAERLSADLIVMGRGGGRPLRDSFLGSTAERVIRQGRKPVLVVRLPARSLYRRPVVGLALDEAAAPVLAMVLRLLPAPRPRITIVHAEDAPYLGTAYARLADAENDERSHRERHAQLAELVVRAFHGHRGRLSDMPVFRTVVRYGDPRTVIKAAVKRSDADLLLVGTQGYSGITRIFLGTVAGDILRDVDCDVMVVPPRRKSSRRG